MNTFTIIDNAGKIIDRRDAKTMRGAVNFAKSLAYCVGEMTVFQSLKIDNIKIAVATIAADGSVTKHESFKVQAKRGWGVDV